MGESWADIVAEGLDTTAEAFRINPANFSDERSLTEHFRSQLVDTLGDVNVEAVTVIDGSSRGAVPDHKDYTDRYKQVEQIECAHCEIGGPKFPFPDDHRIDLGLFDDEVSLQIDGGTQEYDPTDLRAGFEFKYVKNTNYLRYRPERANSKYADIASDITRLGKLPAGVERWCVIFSNYGLLRKDDGTVASGLEELAAEHDVTLRFVLPEVEWNSLARKLRDSDL